MPGLIVGPDGAPRCWWCESTPEYMRYHDTEWGQRTTDDVALFEKLCLESFQSGLSWITILRKRENFRAAFDGFDFHKMAAYDAHDLARLLGDAGIVRHRGKITAVINNAQRASELLEETGSLSDYFWSFAPKTKSPRPTDPSAMKPHTPESTALSKALKRRGWSFLGPTTCFAFMQAMGMVNDHLQGCHVGDALDSLQRGSAPALQQKTLPFHPDPAYTGGPGGNE